MSDTTRAIRAGGMVALAAVMVYVGAELRDRADLGVAVRDKREVATLRPFWVASRGPAVDVPVGEYYDEMTKLLKQQYVEPVTDDMKLASGAVRGMVASLGDPGSLFMDPAEFAMYRNTERGRYEGIGADVELTSVAKPAAPRTPGPTPPPADAEEAVAIGAAMPRLVVRMVVPGGPAAKAGVKPGDVVSTIDGRWVVEGGLLARFRQAQLAFAAKKITYAQINALQKELKAKTERALMPLKARDLLMVGSKGSVAVEWLRGGRTVKTRIARAPSALPPLGLRKGALLIPFVPGIEGSVRQAIAGKSAVSLDLRDNVHGDFATMKRVLALLAPRGVYGGLVTQRAEKPVPLRITSGLARAPKITILVDRTTEGPAAILAVALAKRGLAKLEGPGVGADRAVREVVSLPDGSGYTLVTAFYDSSAAKSGVLASREGSN